MPASIPSTRRPRGGAPGRGDRLIACRAGRCPGRRHRPVERHRAGRDASAPADRPRPDPRDRDGARARSTTPSTRSTAATSRTCSTSTRRRPARSTRRTRPSRPPHTACCWASRRSRVTRALGLVRRDVGGRSRTGRSKQGGIAAGEAAAAAMLDSRDGDGFMAAFTFDIGTEAGDWRPVGWAPRSGARSRPVGRQPEAVPDREPVAVPLGGPERAHERRVRRGLRRGEVARSARTARRGRPTRPPPPSSGSSRRSPLWNNLMLDLAGRYAPRHGRPGPALRRWSTSRLPTRRSRCWNDKYHWNFWRPRAAIREADTDGNPATIADPGWESLFAPATATTPPLATPPFPDHPSGHGCLSGAVLNTMADFFGTDKVEITVVSGRSLNGVPIPPRTFDRFSRRDQGDHRRAGLGRHPLPHRRRAGHGDRQEGRPLGPEALLPARALTWGLAPGRLGSPRRSSQLPGWYSYAPTSGPHPARRRPAASLGGA